MDFAPIKSKNIRRSITFSISFVDPSFAMKCTKNTLCYPKKYHQWKFMDDWIRVDCILSRRWPRLLIPHVVRCFSFTSVPGYFVSLNLYPVNSGFFPLVQGTMINALMPPIINRHWSSFAPNWLVSKVVADVSALMVDETRDIPVGITIRSLSCLPLSCWNWPYDYKNSNAILFCSFYRQHKIVGRSRC